MILHSKLADLIRLLSQSEYSFVKKLIPALTTDAKLPALFELIHKTVQNNLSQLEKKDVHEELFGAEKYHEQKISNRMTELLHCVEEALAFISLRKEEGKRKTLLLKEFRMKNGNKQVESLANEWIDKLDNSEPKNGALFYLAHVNHLEYDNYAIARGVRKKDESLQKASNYLDLYFVVEKLRLTCEMLNRQNIIGAVYDTGISATLINLLKINGNNYLQHPIIAIYYNIYLTLTDGDNPIHYQKLFRLLQKNGKRFEHAEARQLYEYVQNYCIKKVNTGNVNYITEIFNIYQQQLDFGILLNEGELSEYDYKNITSVGLRLEKFDWTHNFIEQYKGKINPSQQKNAYTYNLSSYFYYTQNYKNAIRLLQDVEFTDVFYHMGAKLMLFKMYYETEQTEPFYSLIDAFKVYLYRNKGVSLYQRKSYLNFIRFAKRIFDLKINPPIPKLFQVRISKIQQQMETNKATVSLVWLQERVKEISLSI